MSTSLLILLIIASSSMITNGRSLRSSDSLLPFLFSSAGGDDSNTVSSSAHNQNRLLEVIEHIIKYVSKIKSSEDFVDNIINRQKQVVDKIQILKFLNNCFQVTDIIIQQEIHHILYAPDTNKESLISSSFTLEELQQAQIKIDNLLQVIGERITVLKTWVPPTMPFLSF